MFQPYVHEFEFAQDSQWGQVVLALVEKVGDYRILRDPEAKPNDQGLLPKGSEIRLGGAMYTSDQLGKLDGPGRYVRKPDPVYIKAITGLGAMTKRERRKVRKARQALKRAELACGCSSASPLPCAQCQLQADIFHEAIQL